MCCDCRLNPSRPGDLKECFDFNLTALRDDSVSKLGRKLPSLKAAPHGPTRRAVASTRWAVTRQCHRSAECKDDVQCRCQWQVTGGMGKGALASWKCWKVFFLLQMLSKTSVYEVFMHHFEKMSSASGAPGPHRGAAPGPCWGTSVLQTPSLPTPGKKSCGRPCLYMRSYICQVKAYCNAVLLAYSSDQLYKFTACRTLYRAGVSLSENC